MLLTKDIKEALRRAVEKASHFPYSKKINSFKSAKFVEELGNMFRKMYPDFAVLHQSVNDDGRKKITGEWLYDLVICKMKNIQEDKSNAVLYYDLQWVVESEYNTSLKETLIDFSKVLCSKSNNILYLNGYASTNKRCFYEYRIRRLDTIESIIFENEIKANIYYCFWPSPQKTARSSSFWNENISVLLEIVRLYKYDKITEKFLDLD